MRCNRMKTPIMKLQAKWGSHKEASNDEKLIICCLPYTRSIRVSCVHVVLIPYMVVYINQLFASTCIILQLHALKVIYCNHVL